MPIWNPTCAETYSLTYDEVCVMNKSVVNKPNNAFVVHRKLLIPTIQEEGCARIIRESLSSLGGIQKLIVDIGHKKIHISYDAAQLGFAEIEKTLIHSGFPSSVSWWSKFKSSWYRYLDENAQTNAKSKAGACCSNPSNIYANRRK
jgi:copper chaperone CopZ